MRPSVAPDTHVSTIFVSAPITSAITPATTQQIVPIETRVTTDLIGDMEEE